MNAILALRGPNRVQQSTYLMLSNLFEIWFICFFKHVSCFCSGLGTLLLFYRLPYYFSAILRGASARVYRNASASVYCNASVYTVSQHMRSASTYATGHNQYFSIATLVVIEFQSLKRCGVNCYNF